MTTVDDRSALVVPGRAYGPSAPLLAYAADAAEARGARISRITWTDPPTPMDLGDDGRASWVGAQVAPVLDGLGGSPLLIGKSLGSYAAVLAAERGLPGVWLTPLLTSATVAEALGRATAPVLLVGGTADPSWDGPLARRLSPHVLEVADADHGMYVPGPLARSAEVLGRVATAVEEFLDGPLWR